MNLETRSGRFTRLFDNQVLSRLERWRLNPHRRMTNRSRGEHHSAKGGTSTEFADYRNYVEGDDVRYVDWNLFARLQRPFLKLYRHEEEMHVVLIIDGSASMNFEGKFSLAQQLAGAFSLMGLMNQERVSLYCVKEQGERPLQSPVVRGKSSARRLFQFIEELETGGEAPFEKTIQVVLRQHRGRGIVILLSDFLTFGNLESPFNMLYSAGLEIFGIQILSPLELQPELTGDLRLVDCEDRAVIDVSGVGQLLGLYQEHLERMHDTLASMCRKRNGRFLRISSVDPLEQLLFDTLCRKGWIA